jgi:hypothetical protein
VWYASHATGERAGSRGVQIRISNLTQKTLRDVRLSSHGMERTDLMAGEGTNLIRAGHLSSHRPDGESRRVPVDRMLWKGTALMRFAHVTAINSVLSNAADLRMQSHNVVGVRMENRPPVTTSDGESVLPNLNEGCKQPQDGKPRTPQARGKGVAEFKYGSPTELH